MTTASTASVGYWEPLWAQGRRYRQLDDAERQLMKEHLGPGRGRPALDLGSGTGCVGRDRVPRRSCRFTQWRSSKRLSRCGDSSCSFPTLGGDRDHFDRRGRPTDMTGGCAARLRSTLGGVATPPTVTTLATTSETVYAITGLHPEQSNSPHRCPARGNWTMKNTVQQWGPLRRQVSGQDPQHARRARHRWRPDPQHAQVCWCI